MNALVSAYGSDSEDAAAPVAEPPKRLVSFALPFNPEALRRDEEEERPRKRPTPARAAGGLAALLPKPVHSQLGGGGLGAGGGSKLELGGGAEEAAEAHPSAAYRVAAEAAPAAAEQPDEGWAVHPSAMFALQPGCSRTLAESVGWVVEESGAQALAAAAARLPADAQLASALEEAALRGGGGGVAGAPLMREVSAAQLTAGRERLLATQSATGAAFGPDYEAKLRASAGDKPSDVARRKHQIGSLLHDAKLMELKALEGRIAQSKSKQQTRAKYGW